MSAHEIVKARTAAAHRVVDVAYSDFDLAYRHSYMEFLLAHARVLVPIEALLGHGPSLPHWRPRTALLARDLDALGSHPFTPLVVSETVGLAEKFGLLYVLEGSRFGGSLLSRRLGFGFSSHYLSDTHKAGEWRAFTQALDDRAKAKNADWIEGVVAGAKYGFQLYEWSAAKACTEQDR